MSQIPVWVSSSRPESYEFSPKERLQSVLIALKCEKDEHENDSIVDSEDKDDSVCPICRDTFTHQMRAKCGHCFCNDCILECLVHSVVCPVCGGFVHRLDLIPVHTNRQSSSKASEADQLISSDNYEEQMDLMEFTFERSKKDEEEVVMVESEDLQRALVLEYLQKAQETHRKKKKELDESVKLIQRDLLEVAIASGITDVEQLKQIFTKNGSLSEEVVMNSYPGYSSGPQQGSKLQNQIATATSRQRMIKNFESLTEIYSSIRGTDPHEAPNKEEKPSSDVDIYDGSGLDTFSDILSRVTKHHEIKALATFSFSMERKLGVNSVTSIEFEKDAELFAVAGVNHKIQVYDYTTVLESGGHDCSPRAVLTSKSTINSVAWNNFYQNQLVSGEKDACVVLWDPCTGGDTRIYNEHLSHVFSVDWSKGDPKLFASGSEDTTVKLWSTNSQRSVSTLEVYCSVGCVEFNPEKSFTVAVGCSNSCICLYDFRQPRQPYKILEGADNKLISYVKFTSNHEIVSASDNSTLSLWDVNQLEEACVKSYSGHKNENVFAGLATDGSYIACGSEDNKIYIYSVSLPHPLCSYEFEKDRTIWWLPPRKLTPPRPYKFVSAVTWKKDSSVVVAGNDVGIVSIMELKSGSNPD